MAFQPIVDVVTGKVFAYEALVRGAAGESAGSVLERVTPENLYAFDQKCRVAAIEGAVNAGILKNEAKLSINFLPNAVYSPLACIQLTLRTASATGFPVERLIFEFTENEKMVDTNHVRTIVECYNQMGFGTAIDDFGAGHAGLNLLSALTTDYLKLDMEMIRGIDTKKRNRVIVEGIVDIASRLGVTLIAEGIETVEEYRALREMGVRLFQGYLFAAPAFKALPDIALPDRIVTRAA
ncbi:EAL domain-containing protein [Qipengyuania spongiae]|uniref:EAL domain-containing protein n=1 Tax=Qipengyuania spongiae TaxID=2909673 RepID=A0ABY5SYY2_9SPHN|nr:EAL domain-containing protein [Qipengyuania spongiae]UVI39395.1 EAL domain-containing protein [Qipengyuania spongiae]